MTPSQISLLETIIGHLHAAKAQRSPSDDQIIAEHIETAYLAASDLFDTLRLPLPHAEPLDPMRGVEFPFAENH